MDVSLATASPRPWGQAAMGQAEMCAGWLGQGPPSVTPASSPSPCLVGMTAEGPVKIRNTDPDASLLKTPKGHPPYPA